MDRTIVWFAATVVVALVCTDTDAWVVPAARVTDDGGVTTPWPAVPPAVRLTVFGVAEALDEVITNGAGWPWTNCWSTDWMVRTGVPVAAGVALAWSASMAVAPPACPPVTAVPVTSRPVPVPVPVPPVQAVVWAGGGPMTRPAESWLPSL